MYREKTKKIRVGNTYIGGGSRITVQSMVNTSTKDIEETIKQIKRLENVGCDLVRLAITDEEDASALNEIKNQIKIPLIADIQYDYKLAILAAKNGADCLRLNPGNIGSRDRVKKVVDICKTREIPIRIGVNSGSLKKEFLDNYGGINEKSLVFSALEHIRILEDLNFYDMKISLKSSDVNLSIKAYDLISKKVKYPLHVGITEAGPIGKGSIKSAVGIGSILSRGIGDTIRVSLTGDPVEEVIVGKEILRSLGLIKEGINIISCPTCGRTKINLIPIVTEAERRLSGIDKNISVAIMGCPVNGPGEAKDADVGISGGDGMGIIFRKGQVVRKVREEFLLDELIREIEDM